MPAFRHADFRRLFLGGAAASVSLWTLLLGNAWIVYKLSDSSFWVGVTTFASMSPYLLAPFAGVIADRFERRLLVRFSRMWSFLTTGLLFALAVTDIIAVWMVVGVALLQGIVRSVQISSDQALLANVVPGEDLGNAVALTTMASQGSRAVGPVLAGPLLATIGVQGAYAIAALFALFSYLAVIRIETRSWGGVKSFGDVAGSLREGLSYVRHTGPVLALFLLVVFHCTLTMSFDSMLPGFAETELHTASSGFTIMTLGVGIGALLGTFALSVLTGVRRGPLFLAMGFASGLAPVMMAMSMSIGPAAVSATLMGSSQAMFMALSAMFLQEVIPDAVRGRVMSLYLMSAGGLMAFANLGFGTLADRTGAPILFWIPGSLFVAIMFASIALGPYLRRVYRTGRIAEPALTAAA